MNWGSQLNAASAPAPDHRVRVDTSAVSGPGRLPIASVTLWHIRACGNVSPGSVGRGCRPAWGPLALDWASVGIQPLHMTTI